MVSLRNAALAGMIGPALFIAAVLTLAEYGFMVRLGWDPVGASDVPWPSASAVGPLGWLQVLNFAFFGFTLMVFAIGLHQGVVSLGRASWVGPALLVVAGVAPVLAAFKTDPYLSEGPQTWHGWIHGLYPSRPIAAALPFLLVVAVEERSTLARLRSVHPDHRDSVRGALVRFGVAVGVLPLCRRGPRLDRGDGDPAALR